MEHKTYIDGLEVDHYTANGTLVLYLDKKALSNQPTVAALGGKLVDVLTKYSDFKKIEIYPRQDA